MRDEDVDDTSAAARHNELRDIHHRIDALKEDNERQFHSITKDLHALEVAVARGGKFPPAAWVAAIGLGLTVVSTGAMLYSQLQVTQRIAQDAKDAIQNHVADMVPAQNLVWQLDERVKGLESRIVGMGPNGWHRSDHELYAESVNQRFKTLEYRQQRIEDAQEIICDRIRNCQRK